MRVRYTIWFDDVGKRHRMAEWEYKESEYEKAVAVAAYLKEKHGWETILDFGDWGATPVIDREHFDGWFMPDWKEAKKACGAR